MNLRVVHVVRDLDAASGGPSRSVPALAAAQARIPGLAVTVLFRERGQPRAPLDERAVRYLPVSGDLGRQVAAGCSPPAGEAAACLLHLHGLWDPLLHRAARCARRRGWPYLVSTRGMLAAWALRHKALKKRLAWRLYQRRDLLAADGLLASSVFEQQDIRAALPARRVEVIPNGCDERPAAPAAAVTWPGDGGGGVTARRALALGRLHPVKGYAELIDAWGALRPAGWTLAIAGPDEAGYRGVLEARIRSLGLAGQVVLAGEVDDAAKWSLLDQCELFLAPSRTENFGMAIAEALQSGKPVLTTTGTPWRELPEHGCGWWVPPDAAALAQALRQATATPAETLAEMGARGRRLIREQYSWDGVAARSVELYRAIIEGRAHES